jgi:hypothetical protein
VYARASVAMAYPHWASIRPRRDGARPTIVSAIVSTVVAAVASVGLATASGCFDPTTPIDPNSGASTGTSGTSVGMSEGLSGTGPDPTLPTTVLDSTSPMPQTGSEGSSSGDTGPAAMCGDGEFVMGELCLGEVATIEGGGGATTMHGADFDGDGDLDVVISTNVTAEVFLGDGAGGFVVQPSFMTISSGVGSGDLVTAQLDPGGTTDLIASNGAGAIAGSLGDGDGGFGAPIVTLYPGVNAFGLLPGDYTGDGVTDTLVARSSGYDVHFATGLGDGSFSFTDQIAVEEAGPMVAGDFDGDGNLDAVIVQGDAQSLMWLRGSGSDTMTPQAVPMGVALGFGDAAAADLDGDGTTDAVFPLGETDQVAVVLGAAGIGPTAPILLDTTGEPAAAAIADLDGDGTLDVMSCGSGLFAALSVWRGDGAGGFGSVEELSVTPCAHLVVADLDGDAAVDVAYHEGGPGGLRVVLSQP